MGRGTGRLGAGCREHARDDGPRQRRGARAPGLVAQQAFQSGFGEAPSPPPHRRPAHPGPPRHLGHSQPVGRCRTMRARSTSTAGSAGARGEPRFTYSCLSRLRKGRDGHIRPGVIIPRLSRGSSIQSVVGGRPAKLCALAHRQSRRPSGAGRVWSRHPSASNERFWPIGRPLFHGRAAYAARFSLSMSFRPSRPPPRLSPGQRQTGRAIYLNGGSRPTTGGLSLCP